MLRRRIEKGQASGESLLRVVAIVLDEIHRLERLVKDFLAFARPSPLDVQPTLLDELVGSVAEQVRPEVRQADVELSASLGAGGRGGGSGRRTASASSAEPGAQRPGGDEGGGHLELRTRLDGADNAAIEIIDSGPGFPEDAPIFDAFYTTKESGTGLGLAIVHRIVEEHGGSVGFESRPGRTCFSVRLPLVAPGPMTFR